jgi:hypothetical protein
VDYYVLGRLGMRKMTWVFLPCVAIATTWATMRVSQSALGGKDYAMSVSVADVDSIGRVCRVSRFEQRRAGREQVEQRSVSTALRIDFERPMYGWNSDTSKLVPWEGDEQSNQPPVRYAGKVTGGYDVIEPMFQWSPRLFRETTFGDDPRVNAKALQSVKWSEVDKSGWTKKPGRERVFELVRKALPEATVYIRYLGKTENCEVVQEPAESIALPDGSGGANAKPDAFLQLVASATSAPLTYIEDGNRWKQPVTRPYGLFGLVRQRSPTCGADLEDFQWIDNDDPTEAVLFILLNGDDSVIYRRRLSTASDAN